MLSIQGDAICFCFSKGYLMSSEVVERACLQVTHALCSASLCLNITLTIKLTGYEKSAKLRTNTTSNWKHLLFIFWELVKPLYSGSSVCSNSSPSRLNSLHDLSLLTSVPCCFPCFNNVWPPCTIVISPFSKCKCTRTLLIIGRVRRLCGFI